jgi:hypothetical protein
VAQDLQSLSRVLKESWDKVDGKIPSTADDLVRANQLAAHLLRTVGLREQGPALVAEATDARMRAFTLFLRTYADAQRAVAYLRAEQGDAETLAPSLYTGRGRRKAPDPAPVASPPAKPTTATREVPAEPREQPNTTTAATPADVAERGPFLS